MEKPLRIETIAQFHKLRDLPVPLHPLISIIDVTGISTIPADQPKDLIFEFYAIALKNITGVKIKYGRQLFDFDSGVMAFSAPGQLICIDLGEDRALEQSGWLLLIHPDFLWNTPLAEKIRQYDFFHYSVNEALFVSQGERAVLQGIINNICQETLRPIDHFTQEIIAGSLETLLAYSDRFYQRQFVTRKKISHELLDRLSDLLNQHFDAPGRNKQLPSVADLAAQLSVSPHYLSALLRSVTGMNTQQHIHQKLIEKAKELLSTTSLTVSEISFQLGFEQIQSFSKLFKSKTSVSPVEFRRTLN